MNERDIVRTVTIRHVTEGTAQAEASLRGVAAAQTEAARSAAQLGQESETNARRQASAAESFARLERRQSAAARAMYELERAQRTLNMAVGQNPQLLDRALKTLESYTTKVDAAVIAEENLRRARANQGGSAGQIIGVQHSNAGADYAEQFEEASANATKAAKQQFDLMNSIASIGAEQFTFQINKMIKAERDLMNSIGSIGGEQMTAGINKMIKDQEAAAAAALKLRAAINPMEAEMGRIGKEMQQYRDLLKSGAISSQEFAAFQQVAGKRLEDFGHNLKSAGTAGRLMSGEMANLSYQLNDVVTGLALGQSPFMIIAQQGGQVYQILSNAKGGVAGSIKELGSLLGGLVTPAKVGFGAVAAVILTATTALLKFQEKQYEVARQLSGMGRASGATVSGIDRIAQDNSSLTGFSVSEARNLGAALAATGKIGVDAIGPIVAMGHDFAKAYGVDAAEATQVLARAFADPAKGAEELNERFGFLDARMRDNIQTMVAVGERQKAVKLLTDALKGSLIEASTITSVFSQAWTAVGNAVSGAFDRIGRGADRLFGGGAGLQEKINNLTAELLDLQKLNPASLFGNWEDSGFGMVEERIQAINKQLADLAKQRTAQQGDPEVGYKQRALEIDAFARAAIPAIDAEKRLTEAAGALNQAASDPAIAKYVTVLGTDLVLAAQRAQAGLSAIKGFDPIKNQIADMESSIRLLDQRSPADRGREAADNERRRQQGDPNAGTLEERNRKIGLAALQAAGGQTALDNVERQRIGTLGTLATVSDQVRMKQLDLTEAGRQGAGVTKEQSQQLLTLAREQAIGITQVKAQTDAYRVQTDTVGMGIAAATEYTAWKTRELEAIRNGAPLRENELAQLKAEAKLLGEAAQAAALKNAQDRVNFETKTLGLSTGDLRIAQEMKQIYGEGWQSQMNSSLASQMRFNESIKDMGEIFKSSFSSVGQNIRSGMSAFEAFKKSGLDALGRIADKLMQMALDGLWKAALGGATNSGLSALVGNLFGVGGGGVSYNTAATGGVNPFTGFAGGGYTGSGSKYQPAGIVHAGEYVFDASATARAGVANLSALHSSLRGYAGGGQVSPVRMPMFANNNAPSVVVGDTNVVINGNAGPDEVMQIKRELAAHRSAIAQMARDGRSSSHYQSYGVGVA